MIYELCEIEVRKRFRFDFVGSARNTQCSNPTQIGRLLTLLTILPRDKLKSFSNAIMYSLKRRHIIYRGME